MKILKENPVKCQKFDYFRLQSNNTDDQMKQMLEIEIEYERPISNGFFFIDRAKLEPKTFQLVREILQNLCALFGQYLILDDEIIQSMQLIDPRNRNKINNSQILFRTNLL